MFSIEFVYTLAAASVLAWIFYKAPGVWLAILAGLGVLSGGLLLPVVAGLASLFMFWLWWLYETD
jgi:hypothetical protein